MPTYEDRPPLDREESPDRHMKQLFWRADVTAFRYFVQVAPRAVLNAWSKTDPDVTQHFLDTDADDTTLGTAAHDALRQSRWIGLDHPDFWRVMQAKLSEEEFYGPLLARAGIKTKRTLYRGARHVSLMLRDGVIQISASDYDGPGAWEGVKSREKIRVPEDVSDDELGAAIRRALAMSRPGG